jgi:hypothetical protein
VDTRLVILIAASAFLAAAIAYFAGSLIASGRTRRASAQVHPPLPEAVPAVATDVRAAWGTVPEHMHGREPSLEMAYPTSTVALGSATLAVAAEPEIETELEDAAEFTTATERPVETIATDESPSDRPEAPGGLLPALLENVSARDLPAPIDAGAVAETATRVPVSEPAPVALPEWREVEPVGASTGGLATGETPAWSPEQAPSQEDVFEPPPVSADAPWPSPPGVIGRPEAAGEPDEAASAWSWSMPAAAPDSSISSGPATSAGGLLGPETVEEPPPAPTPEPLAPGLPLPPTVAPEYRMVAPVELLFTDGPRRIGIRPGTATFLRYQRLATVLLGDLRRARAGAD